MIKEASFFNSKLFGEREVDEREGREFISRLTSKVPKILQAGLENSISLSELTK